MAENAKFASKARVKPLPVSYRNNSAQISNMTLLLTSIFFTGKILEM